MDIKKKKAEATLKSLYKIFTAPEAPSSTLSIIDDQISHNMVGFLKQHIVAIEKDLTEVEKDFSSPVIPEEPIFVSEQADFLLNKLVSQSVHTASPRFVGHMTSALPYFMLPLSKIMIALNQNMVKTETSKAFTPLERQVLGMLHKLVYDNEDNFYTKWMHDNRYVIGSFGSGGTVANILALWVARNRMLKAEGTFKGVIKEGLYKACKHYGYEGIAVLVSQLGHYSLGKAADILGIGRDDIISVETDDDNRIKPSAVREHIKQLKEKNIKPICIIGVAGTTETGSVDPLKDLADIAEEEQCYFHVDAAWGGPSLFSKRYRHILNGIQSADSVSIDAHKQLYVPLGAGAVVFKDPSALSAIEHHAHYIIREGSKDLGSHTLEGSRPGMAMLVHSGLKIIGRRGYELLINQGIEKAKDFASIIESHPNFEIITKPELNILTYRYIPDNIRDYMKSNPTISNEKKLSISKILNDIIVYIQKTQRGLGRSFVSRTRLISKHYKCCTIVVFRVVLANPLTTLEHLKEILKEQLSIANQEIVKADLKKIDNIIND